MNVVLALVFAAALAIRFRRGIGETLAPAIFTMVIVLYFSGIFTSLLPGVAGCIGISLISLIYVVINLKKKTAGDGCGRYLLTPGMAALIVFAVYFILADIGREFCARDDLTHWARAVKNELYYHDLSNIALSTDRNKTYPPAAALWNYLGAILWPGRGGFFVDRSVSPMADAAGVQFFSQEMMEAALFLPLFSAVKSLKRDGGILKSVFLVTAFFMIVTGSYQVWLSSVMADPLLGLFALYILWNMLHIRTGSSAPIDRYALYTSCLALFMLALTKEMGIVLAAVLSVSVPLVALRSVTVKERLNMMLKMMLSVGAAVISWYGYLWIWGRIEAYKGIKSASLGNVGRSVSKIGSIDPARSRDIIRTFCYSMFNKNRASFGTLIPLPFAGIMMLTALVPAILFAAVCIRRRQGDKGADSVNREPAERDLDLIRLMAVSWLAGWVFCGLVCIAFVVVFRSKGVTLPSIDRYIAPAVVMLLGLIAGYSVERIQMCDMTAQRGILRGKTGMVLWFAAGMALLFMYGDISMMADGVTVREHLQLPVHEMTQEIAESGVVFKPGEKVYFLMDGEHTSDERYALGYIITPAKNNNSKTDISPDEVDVSYGYLYDADLPLGERLYLRDPDTGEWKRYHN